MDPTDEELENIQDINGCLAWAGVAGDLRTALLAALGDPQRLREVALIPRPAWDANLQGIQIGPGPPHPVPAPTLVEGARIEAVRRVCLLRMGRTPDNPGDPGVQTPAVLGAPLPPVGGSSPGPSQSRKLKLSAVLDPTLDAEIVGLSETEIAGRYDRYKQKYGDFPTPDSDVSKDQLSALAQVISAGAVPFADFSLFGPFGQRLLRRQTYTTFQLNAATGEWSRKEQPGPPDFHSWYRIWKCYRTALLLLEACDAERLDAYSEFIRSQVTQFGDDAWSFISQADCRLRSEHLDRLRRQLRSEPQFGYTDASPRGACYALAIRDAGFWSRELATPATLYLAKHRKDAGREREDADAPRSSAAGSLPKRPKTTRAARRHQGEDKSKKSEDGRFYLNRKGLEICRLYNADKCGSSKASPERDLPENRMRALVAALVLLDCAWAGLEEELGSFSGDLFRLLFSGGLPSVSEDSEELEGAAFFLGAVLAAVILLDCFMAACCSAVGGAFGEAGLLFP
eukprot:s1426_g35.t1